MEVRNICRLMLLGMLAGCLMACHRSAKEEWDRHHHIEHYIPPTDHVIHAGDAWRDRSCMPTDSPELYFVLHACDCPHWVLTSKMGEGVTDSDRDEHSCYIEPSGIYDPLSLDSLENVGMTLMFYGYFDTVKRYPKNADFMDPDPPKGKVFIYCGYRVVDPGRLSGGDVARDDTIDIDP